MKLRVENVGWQHLDCVSFWVKMRVSSHTPSREEENFWRKKNWLKRILFAFHRDTENVSGTDKINFLRSAQKEREKDSELLIFCGVKSSRSYLPVVCMVLQSLQMQMTQLWKMFQDYFFLKLCLSASSCSILINITRFDSTRILNSSKVIFYFQFYLQLGIIHFFFSMSLVCSFWIPNVHDAIVT